MDLVKRREADLKHQDLRIGVLDSIVSGLFTKKGARRPKPEDFLLTTSKPNGGEKYTTPEQHQVFVMWLQATTGGVPVPDYALTPEARANRKAAQSYASG